MVPVVVPPNEKGPKEAGWQNKRYTVEELPAKFNGKNIGLLLGPESGVIAIDIDSKQAQDDLRKLFDGVDIPTTPTWRSKRGGQSLFKWDDRFDAIDKSKFKWNEVEVRLGAGGKAAQSLVPPSITDEVIRDWIVPLSKDSMPIVDPRNWTTTLSRIPGRIGPVFGRKTWERSGDGSRRP
jgi:hypothetical protein